MKSKIETRGGARKNAGRKNLGKVKLLIGVSKDCAKKIRASAKSKEKSLGEIVESKDF